MTKKHYIKGMKNKHINNSDTIDCIRVDGTLIPKMHGGRGERRFKSIKDYNRKEAKRVSYDD